MWIGWNRKTCLSLSRGIRITHDACQANKAAVGTVTRSNERNFIRSKRVSPVEDIIQISISRCRKARQVNRKSCADKWFFLTKETVCNQRTDEPKPWHTNFGFGGSHARTGFVESNIGVTRSTTSRGKVEWRRDLVQIGRGRSHPSLDKVLDGLWLGINTVSTICVKSICRILTIEICRSLLGGILHCKIRLGDGENSLVVWGRSRSNQSLIGINREN